MLSCIFGSVAALLFVIHTLAFSAPRRRRDENEKALRKVFESCSRCRPPSAVDYHREDTTLSRNVQLTTLNSTDKSNLLEHNLSNLPTPNAPNPPPQLVPNVSSR